MAVHLRYMPGNTNVTATFTVPSEPCDIHLYRGESQTQLDSLVNPMVQIVSVDPADDPVTMYEWRYANVGSDHTVTVYLESTEDRTNMSVSMLFVDPDGTCGAPLQ